MTGPVEELVGEPELGDGAGFAVPGSPETIRPRRALIACRLSKTSLRPQTTVFSTNEVATTSIRA